MIMALIIKSTQKSSKYRKGAKTISTQTYKYFVVRYNQIEKFVKSEKNDGYYFYHSLLIIFFLILFLYIITLIVTKVFFKTKWMKKNQLPRIVPLFRVNLLV